jgi:hypothetical protein
MPHPAAPGSDLELGGLVHRNSFLRRRETGKLPFHRTGININTGAALAHSSELNSRRVSFS